jgi:hypothetical protein
VPTSEMARSSRQLAELFHHRPSWREERAPKGVGIAFFPRIFLSFILINLGLPAGRREMPELVPSGLIPTISSMSGIDQNASADRIVICEEPRHLGIKLAAIHSDTELKLQEREQALNWSLTEPKPTSEALCILLCL